MKKNSSKLCLGVLLVMISIFLFSACKKSEKGPQPTGTPVQATETVRPSPSPYRGTAERTNSQTTVPTAATNATSTGSAAATSTPTPIPATKSPTKAPTAVPTPLPTRTPAPTPTKAPAPVPYGLDITDKKDLVSICYSTWFNPIVARSGSSSGIYNITEILAGRQEWGPENAFHFWGEPAVGYYRSDDKSVIRTHMTQLAEAGVDFIIIDNTNAQANTWGAGVSGSYWDKMVTKSCQALLDTILQMQSEGKKTPYVVFWNRVDDQGWATPVRIYKEFYKNGKYKDCWVYWDGKPLMLVNILNQSGATDVRKFAYRNEFTLRQQTVAILSGPLAKNEWSFLYDGSVPCKDSNGNYEQISVYAARQSTYMSNTSTAIGRRGGETFYKQWRRAFQYHPKVVTLTWWNEWAAQRFIIDGKSTFTDNYNQEFSRDIEPMNGGHGDQYYRWMKQYIAAYKAHQGCPKLVE
ncbi:MAG: hypothetical protein ACLSVG_06700 [Clostridia bacterium]